MIEFTDKEKKELLTICDMLDSSDKESKKLANVMLESSSWYENLPSNWYIKIPFEYLVNVKTLFSKSFAVTIKSRILRGLINNSLQAKLYEYVKLSKIITEEDCKEMKPILEKYNEIGVNYSITCQTACAMMKSSKAYQKLVDSDIWIIYSHLYEYKPEELFEENNWIRQERFVAWMTSWLPFNEWCSGSSDVAIYKCIKTMKW